MKSVFAAHAEWNFEPAKEQLMKPPGHALLSHSFSEGSISTTPGKAALGGGAA
jgi:hypothetical protein